MASQRLHYLVIVTLALHSESDKDVAVELFVLPPSFRLGSGASALPQSETLAQLRGTSKASRLTMVPSTDPDNAESQGPTSKASRLIPWGRLAETAPSLATFLTFGIVGILLLMVPVGAGALGGRENSNYRVPPTWSPEGEHNYSFRAYMTDISLWIMLTDLQPHQQCAAIIMRLGGAAREMARMITPQEMAAGGVRNGVHVDPVTYLLGALHLRFGALEEESRLTVMTDMLAFSRKPGENINNLLARYETVRQRAAIEGQFVMSVEGCSLQLLRACGIQASHLVTLLQPYQGRLPTTEQQFNELFAQLRRFGHMTEGVQGNVATVLSAPFRPARPGTYHTQSDQASTFLATSQQPAAPPSAPASAWDALLPAPLGHASNDPFASWGARESQSADHTYLGTATSWNGRGSQSADPGHHGTWNVGGQAATGEDTIAAFMADYEWSEGTDSETSSDDGQEVLPDPGVHSMSRSEAAAHVFLQYRRAKRTWRRYTGKPVRRFRKTIKKIKGHRKGRGKGFFWTHDDTLTYLKGKGKGQRKNTTGKGHGRRGNPEDKDGNIMRCSICNSTEHFRANCPQGNSGGKGGSSGSSSSFAGLAMNLHQRGPNKASRLTSVLPLTLPLPLRISVHLGLRKTSSSGEPVKPVG